MNKFDIRARLYEVIQTKMLRMEILPDTFGQTLFNTVMLNYDSFSAGMTEQVVSEMSLDPEMPAPHREYNGYIDQGMSIAEVILNEEINYISSYFKVHLQALIDFDYSGLRFSYATLDFKSIDLLKKLDCEAIDNADFAAYMQAALNFITAEAVERFVVNGMEVSIMHSPELTNKFARVNIAGIDIILMRGLLKTSEGNVIPIHLRR